MRCRVVGWPADGPRLELDHREFAYAGKFVMTRTGKAVVEADGEVLAAVAFGPDRTDDELWWLRIVTVRRDRQGEGLGPRVLDFTAERVLERADRVRIAVNNPFAYEAAYKAGFGYLGDETGLAELVLERPSERDDAAYRDGLAEFADRERLGDAERAFVEARGGTAPPLFER